VRRAPSDPSSYNKGIAWQLDWVIQKALSKDPAERFGGATEFAEGLRLGLQDTVGRALTPTTAGAAGCTCARTLSPALSQGRGSYVPCTSPALKGEGEVSPKGEAEKSVPNLVQKAQAIATARPPTPLVPPPSAEDSKKPRVLFVDDDERILNGLKSLFREEYQVYTAENGEAALELVKSFPMHVVVSDQRMPGLTGVEVLRARAFAQRRSHPAYWHRPRGPGRVHQRGRDLPLREETVGQRRAAQGNGRCDQDCAGARGQPPPQPGRRAPRVATGHRSPGGLARGLERLLAGEATVTQVSTPAEASEVRKTQEIAAIVADLGAGMDGLVALFKTIKAKRPKSTRSSSPTSPIPTSASSSSTRRRSSASCPSR
jgi:serine/threonine-protein kinase